MNHILGSQPNYYDLTSNFLCRKTSQRLTGSIKIPLPVYLKWKYKLSLSLLVWNLDISYRHVPSGMVSKWPYLISQSDKVSSDWLRLWSNEKPKKLKTIYSDFLTNWTDTLICFFYVTHFIFLTIAKCKSLNDENATHWTLYIIQIVYEISLTSSVLGTDLSFLRSKVIQGQNFSIGWTKKFEKFWNFWFVKIFTFT